MQVPVVLDNTCSAQLDAAHELPPCVRGFLVRICAPRPPTWPMIGHLVCAAALAGTLPGCGTRSEAHIGRALLVIARGCP